MLWAGPNNAPATPDPRALRLLANRRGTGLWEPWVRLHGTPHASAIVAVTGAAVRRRLAGFWCLVSPETCISSILALPPQTAVGLCPSSHPADRARALSSLAARRVRRESLGGAPALPSSLCKRRCRDSKNRLSGCLIRNSGPGVASRGLSSVSDAKLASSGGALLAESSPSVL